MVQKKWKAIWIVLAVFFLAIVAGMALFDWNWVRDPGARYAGKLSGRDITVGNLRGEWGLHPRFLLEDLHVSNVDWSEEPEMLSAKSIEVVVDIPQLMRGRLAFPEIKLIGPKVVLEKNQDGQDNWTFAAKEAAGMAAPDERGEMPLIGRLTIEDGHLIYRNPAVGLDIDGRISSAEGTGGDKGQSQLTFKGEGRLQGEAFRANVTGGSLLTLREGEKPYPVRVDIEAASSHLLISGTLEDPVQVEGLDLRIALEGPDLSRLTRITGVPLPMTPTYKLSGVLERDGQRWAVRGLDGEMGHSDLSGDVFYDATGERTKVEADLHSKVLDYRDVGPLIGLEAQREEGDGEAEKKDPAAPPPKVLPTAPLSIEQVRNIEADVRFKGDKVEAPNVPLDGVEMALTIDDGVLTLKPITVGVAGGTTEAVIKVDARKEPVVTDYNIRLKNYALEDFFAAAGLEGKAKGRIDGRIRLKGTGNTVAESLGSAGGDIRLVMEEGEVSNLGLELAGLDLAQSLGVLAQGDAPVPIRCFVADFNVDDGAVWPRVFVFDTTDTTLTADGGLNFKDESLNLRLSAHPKDSSLAALRSPITVKGSFSRPDLGVEKAPLVARAGAALALGALLTPLAAILAFIDPSLQKDSDCGALLQDYPVSK